MSPTRPIGVNVIVAFVLLLLVLASRFAGAFLIGELGGIAFLNIPILVPLALAVIGLWRLKRWGFWITIGLSGFFIVISFYGILSLLSQAHPYHGTLTDGDMTIFTLGGPIQLVASILIIIYLFRRKGIFL